MMLATVNPRTQGSALSDTEYRCVLVLYANDTVIGQAVGHVPHFEPDTEPHGLVFNYEDMYREAGGRVMAVNARVHIEFKQLDQPSPETNGGVEPTGYKRSDDV